MSYPRSVESALLEGSSCLGRPTSHSHEVGGGAVHAPGLLPLGPVWRLGTTAVAGQGRRERLLARACNERGRTPSASRPSAPVAQVAGESDCASGGITAALPFAVGVRCAATAQLGEEQEGEGVCRPHSGGAFGFVGVGRSGDE
jgi:hypothetical protein